MCTRTTLGVFGKKCTTHTGQVCYSTRINRLLDLDRAFNPFLVFQREIEKQTDIMFKLLVVFGLLAVANVYAGLVKTVAVAPAPVVKTWGGAGWGGAGWGGAGWGNNGGKWGGSGAGWGGAGWGNDGGKWGGSGAGWGGAGWGDGGKWGGSGAGWGGAGWGNNGAKWGGSA